MDMNTGLTPYRPVSSPPPSPPLLDRRQNLSVKSLVRLYELKCALKKSPPTKKRNHRVWLSCSSHIIKDQRKDVVDENYCLFYEFSPDAGFVR